MYKHSHPTALLTAASKQDRIPASCQHSCLSVQETTERPKRADYLKLCQRQYKT